MDLIEFISKYGSWSWIVGGLILLALELMLPGGILIWLGLAAVATGLVTFIIPIGWAMQWAIYGALALISIILWLKYGRKAMNTKTDNPFLNDRAKRFIGREIVLDKAIDQGYGRVKLDDTIWRVSGQDMAKGSMVKITGYEGAVLEVEEIS